jgi:photoactive yellow protein
METIQFKNVDLAELLPRIPESIKNGLPFGLVKLDMQGNIIEYNMAEGDLTGVDPKWAVGRNFFDEVAVCTKTQAFYGRFVEGVKKGFLNAVFDYIFDHRDEGVRVKVHMVMVPDHLGRKVVMLLVKRMDQPVVMKATPDWPPAEPSTYGDGSYRQHSIPSQAEHLETMPASLNTVPPAANQSNPSVKDIVEAVMAVLNQGVPNNSTQQLAQAAAAHITQKAQPAAPSAVTPAPIAATSKAKHEDIFKL